MYLKLIVIGLALLGTAHAAVLDLVGQASGQLATAQTATGVTANEADFGVSGRRGAAVFQIRNTAGTATIELQMNCIQGTADWVTIPGSSTALTVGNAVLDITRPGCRYRGNVTACSSCSLTATVTSIAGQ